jgi:O-antigen ligase
MRRRKLLKSGMPFCSKTRLAVVLLGAALLFGGLRDPRLFSAGAAALWSLVWLERPALGPATAWLPWLAWATLSAAWSAQPLAALPFLSRWAAVLAFASLAAAWGAKEREEWLKALLIAAGILAAAAAWTGYPIFRNTMTGLIPPYYNYTAFALAAASAAAAAWALHPRGPRLELRVAALAAAAAFAACIGLAHSRGAALALVFAAAVWAARRWGAKAGAVLAVAAALAGGAFSIGRLPAALQDVLLKRGRQVEEARPAIWRRAAEIASEKPWLGEGPGNFGVGFLRRPVEARGAQARWALSTDYAHSELFQAAAETGWAGLALWLLGLGTSLSVLLRRSDNEPAREAAAAAAAAMAAQLAVDNMLQIPGLALLLFSALAVAGARPSCGPRWPRAAVIAGALLALVAWLPRALAEGNPARAAALFPREAAPREDLAYRAMAAGKLGEADTLWAEAEKLAPFNAVYPWRRAQIAAAQGNWEAAREFAGRAAEDEPGFLNDRVLRAEALARRGRKLEARAELAQVDELLRTRGNPAGFTHYDATIWDFDRKEFDRVAALAGLKGR